MFVRSTRAGSFSGAARLLGVTPAAVSKQVGRLEQALGVQLLVRTTRKLIVTDEGRHVFAQTEPAMEALRAAVSGARSGKREIGGVLRVSLPAAFGRQYVLPTLRGRSVDRRALLRVSCPPCTRRRKTSLSDPPPPERRVEFPTRLVRSASLRRG